MDEKLYSVADAAKHFGVHRKTLYDWMRNGKLTYIAIGDRRVFRQRDIDGCDATRNEERGAEKNKRQS